MNEKQTQAMLPMRKQHGSQLMSRKGYEATVQERSNRAQLSCPGQVRMLAYSELKTD